MDPIPYKGFEIGIRARRDIGNWGGYIGMYEIFKAGAKQTSAVIAGAFVVEQHAEDAALEQAKRWIDNAV